jgi:hypothetical protein
MERKFGERPGILTEEQAKPILEPYVPGLIGDFHDSWDWVQAILDQDTERRVTFDTSTQAAMVFNRFALLTSRRHSSDDAVKLKRYGRMLRALIGDGRVALRFKKLVKKLDGQLCASNVHTNAQSLIYNQLSIDGMEDAWPTEITFGYTTDEANTTVTGLYFTCPVSWYSNKWVFQLEGDSGEGTLPYASPTGPNDPTGPMPDQATVFIKIKKEA